MRICRTLSNLLLFLPMRTPDRAFSFDSFPSSTTGESARARLEPSAAEVGCDID